VFAGRPCQPVSLFLPASSSTPSPRRVPTSSGTCVPEPLSGPTCDDGIDTTVNDTCTAGVCQVGCAWGSGPHATLVHWKRRTCFKLKTPPAALPLPHHVCLILTVHSRAWIPATGSPALARRAWPKARASVDFALQAPSLTMAQHAATAGLTLLATFAKTAFALGGRLHPQRQPPHRRRIPVRLPA
jgi:hypothetical protein